MKEEEKLNEINTDINYDGMKEQMIKYCSNIRLADINEESFWQYSTFLRRVAKEEPLTDELGCPSNFGADLNIYPVYGRDENGVPYDGLCFVEDIVKDLPGQPLQMEQCRQCWLMMTNKVYNNGE